MKLLRLLAATACLTIILGAHQCARASALPSVDCAALSTPVYEATKSNGTTLLTLSEGEARAATNYGFKYRGVAFNASRTPESELVPVHRLYNVSGDFAFVAGEDIDELLAAGYEDQSTAFYAAQQSSECTRGVWQFVANGRHQYQLNKPPEESSVAFFVAALPKTYPAPTKVSVAAPEVNSSDREFTFAVIPDTQQEVHNLNDPRLANRTQWLADNRNRLDLRWAVQVGDLVDWDTDDHYQYQLARSGLLPLIREKIPLFLNIGNHDSQATTVGGGARDPRFTRSLARMTQVMNSYFSTADYSVQVGSFEPGKVDNTYTRVKAGGKSWLLLNLELWPRPEVINWAAALVRYHKHHNVIISTHSFVDRAGSLSSSANYGSTSPRYLWDHLIKKYKNVKFVLSGHVGTARTFVMKGSGGNKVYAMLTAYHSNSTNPVRLVKINTASQRMTTWVEGPWTNQVLQPSSTFKSIGLVS